MKKPYGKFVKNAAGRMVPTEVNGRKVTPYKGVGKFKPKGRKAAPPIATCANFPDPGNKLVKDIKAALQFCRRG